MATVVAGALLGWAFSGSIIAWGLATTVFGAIMMGASLGSLFMGNNNDFGDYSSSPTYSFGQVSNTMSQLLPIPVVCGKMRVAGNIIYQAFGDDTKETQTLYVLIGEGPVEEISSVMCNDQDPTALEDCSVTVHLDTDSATTDSRDPSGTRPYPDHVALVCMSLKAQEKLSGTPTVTSIVKGVKIWTPNGVVWSRNPVWHVVNMLCNPRYGLGYCVKDASGNYSHPDWDKIDYDCAVAAANYCDTVQSDGNPLFAFDFVFDTRTTIRDALSTMLSVCRGYLLQTDKLEIHIDAPVSAYAGTIDGAHIVKNSFTTWQASDQDVYNRLSVEWINPDDSYERTSDVFEAADDINDRGAVEKTVSLLGITNDRQVGQMGFYLLSTSLNVQNFCSFSVGFKDVSILPGEVYNINFPKLGWTNRPARVVSVKSSEGSDSMLVTCSEYVEACYNGTAYSLTPHISTNVYKNYKPADCTDLALSEQLETSQDGGYVDKLKAIWTPPQSCSGLVLWYRYQSDATWTPLGNLPRNATEYFIDVTSHIRDTVYVKIYAVSNLGIVSDGVTASKIIRGDTTPPAKPTNVAAVGGFRMATISWTDPGDADLDHIDVYRSLDSDSGAYVKIGSSVRYAQSFIDSGLSVLQTVWYKLKAVDVAGNESDYTDVVSCTSEALKMKDLPDQSIPASKLIPQLDRLIASMRQLAQAAMSNTLATNDAMDAAASATEELSTRVTAGLEAEAADRTLLAAKLNSDVAYLQQLLEVIVHKVTVTNSTTEPISPVEGDVWINGSTYKRYDGAAWQTITETEAQSIINAVVAQYTLLTDVNGHIAGFGVKNSNISGSEIAFVADKLYLATAASDTQTSVQVFSIDTTGDTPKFVMNGNLFVNSAKGAGSGWIIGNMISAAAQIQLGDGGSLITGADTIVQMASGVITLDSETGVIQVKDPSNLSTGNYIKIEVGDITSYKYINGAYRAMKSLRKMEVGTGNNGATVTLPGYWPSQPKIQVSANALQSYNASYSNQSQELVSYADAVSFDAASGVVTFVPRAYLQIAAGGGNVGTPVSPMSTATGNSGAVALPKTITLSSYALPANAKNIVVTAKFYAQFSQRGTLSWEIKATIQCSFNGTTYTLASNVSIPITRYNLTSEPTGYYITCTVTIPGEAASAQNLSLWGTFSVGTNTAVIESGVTYNDASYAWLRLESIQWSLAASTQLAAGTLNYVAIAE